MKHFTHNDTTLLSRTIAQLRKDVKAHRINSDYLGTWVRGTANEFLTRLMCTGFVHDHEAEEEVMAKIVGMSIASNGRYTGGCLLLEFTANQYHGHGGQGGLSSSNYLGIPHTTDSCWWVF